MNWKTVIMIAILLIVLDKAITVINIKLVEKNHPGIDALEIEKNPVAKYFFKTSGLWGGTLLMAILSIGTFLIGIWLMHFATELWAPNNSYGVALYLMMLFYGFVIMNNFYFMFKYGGWI